MASLIFPECGCVPTLIEFECNENQQFRRKIKID
jgi:hypothetical protein